MKQALSLTIIEKEYIWLIWNIFNRYTSRPTTFLDLEKRVWIDVASKYIINFWFDHKEIPNKALRPGCQIIGVEIEEGDEFQSLDYFSRKYIEPVAWEICLPAIPPEILYYWAQ